MGVRKATPFSLTRCFDVWLHDWAAPSRLAISDRKT